MRHASAFVLLILVGCAARRELTVRSDPPGAQVRIDGHVAGRTPCTVDFGAYGVRRVTLHREGYRSHAERIELSPPWYARFPIDVVTEVLLPFGWRDRRELEVELVPGGEPLRRPALRSVFERAEVLRSAGLDGPRSLPKPEIREAARAGKGAQGADGAENFEDAESTRAEDRP